MCLNPHVYLCMLKTIRVFKTILISHFVPQSSSYGNESESVSVTGSE